MNFIDLNPLMDIDQLKEVIQQRVAQSRLVRQDQIDGQEIKRRFRIQQIVNHVLQEYEIHLNNQEYKNILDSATRL